MYRWIKDYHPIVSKHLIYSPAEFYDISRKLAKAKHQLEIIKLSQCMDEIPLTKRLEMLDDLHEREKQYLSLIHILTLTVPSVPTMMGTVHTVPEPVGSPLKKAEPVSPVNLMALRVRPVSYTHLIGPNVPPG